MKAEESWNAALEAAARECERHAEFCRNEALHGGDRLHLMARKDEATYNAQRIRQMKAKDLEVPS